MSVSIHTLSHQPDLDSSRVSARLDVRTPPGLLPRLRDARSSLMGSGSLYFSKARERGSHRGGDLIASAHLDYRPIPPTRWFDGAGGTFDVLHGPADSVTAELARAEGLVVRVAIDLYRPVTRASLPLREGALAEVEGGRVQIRGVDLSAHRPKVTVSLISWRRELVGDAPPSIGSSLDFGFVHHTRGETLRPLAMHGSGGAIEGMLGGAFVEVEERTFEYGVGPWDSVPGPGWFRSAELEVLELEYVGTVERTVGQVISEWPLLGSRVVLAPEDGR